MIKNSNKVKTLKTIKEDSKKKNLKSVDITNNSKQDNKELIKKAKKWKLPGYHVVNEWTKKEYLRSNPDKKKIT